MAISKEKITNFFVKLAKGIYTMPKLGFNRKLFQKLVKENLEQNQSTIAAPEVEFTQGPIDGVLGSYNSETKKIEIEKSDRGACT